MSRFTIEVKDLDASLGNADMTEVEALALAQLCKRLTFSDTAGHYSDASV